MKQFEERVNGRRIHFHQCPFGGITAKLTTLSANLLGMEALDGVRCPGISQSHQHGVSIGRCPDGASIQDDFKLIHHGCAKSLPRCCLSLSGTLRL